VDDAPHDKRHDTESEVDSEECRAMNIVLLTHYYPPEVNAPALRASQHAKIWLEQGHEVTIVTAAPSHPYGRVYEGYENETHEETVDGIRILRLKTTLGANAGIAKRAWNYVSFLVAVGLNRRLIGKADIVISTSPQFFCGLAGWIAARHCKAPWILEIRDIWPESIIAVGAAGPGLATRVLSMVADWAYRTSARIVSVSPGFNSHFESRGIPAAKIELIPNGIDTAMAPVPAEFSEFPELQPIEGRFIAAYIGTLGMAHGLMSVIEAAELLKDENGIGIVLVGSGAERDQVAAEINKRGLSNIVLLDQQPRDRIIRLFSLIDASIVHLKKQDVFKTVIPTKLLEAMAMAKPVALGVEGTASDILNAAGGGITFEPENAREMADAIKSLASDPEKARALAEAGRAHVREHFDRRTMAMKYLDVMERVVAESRR
jgi:glycosyltransferase involved in cell wall biosynthesis